MIETRTETGETVISICNYDTYQSNRDLAAAAGFTDVRIQMRNPVAEDVRLSLLPGSGLPPPVIKVLNENVARLNALLFAPLDYALIARR